MPSKPIVIMGPTASGKTEAAIALAKITGGEIISADSRQIYSRLCAGTAKPQGNWTQTASGHAYMVEGVPYHLVDFLDPRASWDAGSFITAAGETESAIKSRGALPIFAGGSGMYIQAYWNGLDVLPKSDAELRKTLVRMAEERGAKAMHDKLRETDPEAAEKIPPGNIQRVLRALEVRELTGIPISKLWTKKFYGALPSHKAHFFVLSWNKETLHSRITARAHATFDAMCEETDRLLKDGYPEDCPALKSLGYPQAADYLRARSSRTEALHRLISLTQAYAKRQTTWLRRYRNAIPFSFENGTEWNPSKIAQSMLSIASSSMQAHV